jgi:hypothetical protein
MVSPVFEANTLPPVGGKVEVTLSPLYMEGQTRVANISSTFVQVRACAAVALLERTCMSASVAIVQLYFLQASVFLELDAPWDGARVAWTCPSHFPPPLPPRPAFRVLVVVSVVRVPVPMQQLV